MSGSESEDELIDRVVDRVMRGEDPDVERLIADASDMSPATCEKLRKLAGTFGSRPLAATVVRARETALPFTELGPYKLLSRMGEGGMGMVYLAEHRFLERRVALKIIRPELAFSEVTRQRFHREATSIAKLRHENIVSVYDAGEHEGVAFLAMELVEGQGLDELLQSARRKGERIDVKAAVRHARGIARALQCAHEAGIIHRDVKPSNVRITPDGRELLVDFGLSLADEAAAISTVGHFRGTPQYASPEQVEMESVELDARTDVYSLGITLYECLTGQVPFTSGRMNQLFHQIVALEPVAPRKLDGRVDEALNEIVMRAIAKRREDRFASAGEMADALDGWLAVAERPVAPPRRETSGVRSILVAAVVLAACVAAWLLLRDGEHAPASAAQSAVASSAQGVPASAKQSAPEPAPQHALPVTRVDPRVRLPLFGADGLAFDRRLEGWDPLVGGGTFGADLDGSGVVGNSVDGLTARPHSLPVGSFAVSGRIDTTALKPGARTHAAGIGIELSDGRTVAALLDSAHEGYRLRVCELVRDAASAWTRGTDIASGSSAWAEDKPVQFRVSWNDTDMQFDWSDAAKPARSESLLLPRTARAGARPTRFLLIVERRSASFEEVMLEES